MDLLTFFTSKTTSPGLNSTIRCMWLWSKKWFRLSKTAIPIRQPWVTITVTVACKIFSRTIKFLVVCWRMCNSTKPNLLNRNVSIIISLLSQSANLTSMDHWQWFWSKNRKFDGSDSSSDSKHLQTLYFLAGRMCEIKLEMF